jgi:hypothetical protein
VWGTTMRCAAKTWRLSKCVHACVRERASLSDWAAESWCSKVCSYMSLPKLRSSCGSASWRQLTATAKRRLYGNAIVRDFTMYPRPCGFLLLGHIIVKLDVGNASVVCLFVCFCCSEDTRKQGKGRGNCVPKLLFCEMSLWYVLFSPFVDSPCTSLFSPYLSLFLYAFAKNEC